MNSYEDLVAYLANNHVSDIQLVCDIVCPPGTALCVGAPSGREVRIAGGGHTVTCDSFSVQNGCKVNVTNLTLHGLFRLVDVDTHLELRNSTVVTDVGVPGVDVATGARVAICDGSRVTGVLLRKKARGCIMGGCVIDGDVLVEGMSELTCADSSIAQTTTKTNGIAVKCETKSTLNMTNMHITSTAASAIIIKKESKATLKDCAITAAIHGVAVCVDSEASCTKCVVYGAALGFLVQQQSKVVLTDCEFVNEKECTGIRVNDKSQLTVHRCHVVCSNVGMSVGVNVQDSHFTANTLSVQSAIGILAGDNSSLHLGDITMIMTRDNFGQLALGAKNSHVIIRGMKAEYFINNVAFEECGTADKACCIYNLLVDNAQMYGLYQEASYSAITLGKITSHQSAVEVVKGGALHAEKSSFLGRDHAVVVSGGARLSLDSMTLVSDAKHALSASESCVVCMIDCEVVGDTNNHSALTLKSACHISSGSVAMMHRCCISKFTSGVSVVGDASSAEIVMCTLLQVSVGVEADNGARVAVRKANITALGVGVRVGANSSAEVTDDRTTSHRTIRARRSCVEVGPGGTAAVTGIRVESECGSDMALHCDARGTLTSDGIVHPWFCQWTGVLFAGSIAWFVWRLI